MSSATNPLGAFNYVYVNATPRLDHANYPNGQVAQYAYFPNTGDQRLQEIWNKTSTGATISKFDYSYNAVGDILSWSQQTDANTPFVHSFDYDPIDQLLNDTVALNGTTQHQYSYAYDWGGNRTAEQIDSTVSPATYNNLNQLTNRGGNGQAIFEGALDKPGTVTIGDGSPGVTDASNHFRVMASIVAGSNLLPITAVDAYGNTKGQHVQWTVNGNGSQALTYDSVGNLTSDGSRIYEWDAANRCIAINQGTHRTEMTYDGFSREVKRVEKENGTIVSTKQFIWCALQRCEERDASNQVSKRFYSQGEQIGGSAYFYNRDHLGSIRELTDGNRIVRARYDYDPYGRRTKLSGDLDADFGFTGHYISSQYLDLAFDPFRIYGADLGRWISRDPIGEAGGINLYGYVQNEPINRIDDLGLASIYTDQIDGVTYFNPNPEMPGPIFSWPSRSDVVPGSLPGAGGPYDSADVYPAEGPLHNNPRAYGPNDALLTDDPRGRWLHGGGSGLDNPLAPRQGWYPTHGCTRMQNDDIQHLVDKVRDFKEKNPGIPVPYSRSRPPVGDFARGFGGAFRNFA